MGIKIIHVLKKLWIKPFGLQIIKQMMRANFVKLFVLSVLALLVSTSVSAQYEEPFVIEHDAPHYEYHLETSLGWDIGKPGVGYGSILFESNPSGASVYVDDIYQGKTPLMIDNVPDGTYDTRLEYNGYLNYYSVVNVAARLQSHVTAGMQMREKLYFAPRELYTTVVDEYSKLNAVGWGVGNSWGIYYKNINLEQSTLVHIGMLNTVTFEGAIGYGFLFGHFNRFRLTPQIGYSAIWLDDVENAKSNWSGALRGALNFKCAFCEQYAFSATLLYDKSGPGIRAGVLFFVN